MDLGLDLDDRQLLNMIRDAQHKNLEQIEVINNKGELITVRIPQLSFDPILMDWTKNGG